MGIEKRWEKLLKRSSTAAHQVLFFIRISSLALCSMSMGQTSPSDDSASHCCKPRPFCRCIMTSPACTKGVGLILQQFFHYFGKNSQNCSSPCLFSQFPSNNSIICYTCRVLPLILGILFSKWLCTTLCIQCRLYWRTFCPIKAKGIDMCNCFPLPDITE